jgi:N-methylhydantoinase B
VRDSGGPGKWRGCLSIVRQLRFLEKEGVLQIRSDRRRFLPYGLNGGQDGTSSWNILNPGPNQEVLPTNITHPIMQGDVLKHTTAGGGGFSDPLERDPQLVLRDVLDDKISVQHAAEAYGVIIAGKITLDSEQTSAERSRRRQTNRGHTQPVMSTATP